MQGWVAGEWVAIALGFALLVAARRRGWVAALSWAAVPFLVWVVLGAWWVTLYVQPAVPSWDGARLTAALVVRLGLTLYPAPETGSVLSWFYGPVAALAYMPATLGTNPIAMLLIARGMSLVYFFGPLLWLLGREAQRGRTGHVTTVCGVALAATIADSSAGLRYASTAVLADNPALGLGLVALIVLTHREGPPGPFRLALAIAAATLAAWSKQLAAPLLPLIVLWAWWVGGRRHGLWALAFSIIATLISTSVFIIYFGGPNLLFGLGSVLVRYPYRVQGAWPVARAAAEALGPDLVPLLALNVVGAGLTLRGAGRPFGWGLFPLWAFFNLPLASLSYAKVGGDVNSLAFVTTPMLAGGCLLWVRAAMDQRWAAWGLLALTLLFGWLQSQRLEEVRAPRPPAWLVEERMVISYLKAHPGEAYFPERPLDHLAVERRFTHQEYGLLDRDLAGFPLAHEHIRQGMPPDARRLVYPAGLTYAGYFAHRALPEFQHETQVPELPGAIVHERD